MECVLNNDENRRESYGPVYQRCVSQMEEAHRLGAFSIATLTQEVMSLVSNKELAEVAPNYFRPGANLFVDTTPELPLVSENTDSSSSTTTNLSSSVAAGDVVVSPPETNE